MHSFLLRSFANFCGLAAATWLTGIESTGWIPLILVSLLLTIVKVVVRPFLLLLSLPLIILTMGLFILIVNALILWGVSGMVPGFSVPQFSSAFFGALILSVVSTIVWLFIRHYDSQPPPQDPEKRVKGRVIDV